MPNPAEHNLDPQEGEILAEEDEETLAAIDRGIKAADQGRLIELDQVRRRLREWPTPSSSVKRR